MMAEDINWDEIRRDDDLLRPSAFFDPSPAQNQASQSSAFDMSEGMDAPLLRDDAYTEIPIQDSGNHLDLWNHCHWSPKVANKAAGPQLLAATLMCAVFMIGELVGGYLAGSLAIMCDAAHLLSDCAGFLLALSALFLSKRPPGPRMSFGYRRAEVLGALMSILLIWMVTGIFVYLAIVRLYEGTYDIQVDAMMIVSGVGMIVNVLMALILHGACPGIAHVHNHGHSHAPSSDSQSLNSSGYTDNVKLKQIGNPLKNGYRNLAMDPIIDNGQTSSGNMAVKRSGKVVHTAKTNILGDSNGLHQTSFEDVEMLNGNSHRLSSTNLLGGEVSEEQSINVRAAVIHVLGDLIQSAGVFIASVVIKIYPEAKVVDPLCTFVFSIIVMCTTVRILREATTVLMEGVPTHVRYESVLAALRGLSGVRAVHSLHIWSITNHNNILTAHVAIDQYTDSENTLKQALHIVKTKFRIDLATIQVEKYNEEMTSCSQCASNTDT